MFPIKMPSQNYKIKINILKIYNFVRFIPKLPQQAAFSLYNYLIGELSYFILYRATIILLEDVYQWVMA